MTLAVTTAATSQAGDGRRATKPQSERLARARWQPVRQSDGPKQKADSGSRSSARSSQVRQAGGVKKTQATEYYGPAPTPIEGEVVLEPAPYGYPGPISEGVGCDEMVCGGEGCGGCGGVGCDSPSFCDSPGCDGGCDSACGASLRPCLTICLPQDGWVSAEYLLWYQDGMSLPPLITRSAAGTNPVLPGADILYGGDSDNLDESLDGFRLDFGVWLDRQHLWAVQGEYLDLATLSSSFTASGTNGGASIGRPYNDISESGAPGSARIISRTGVATGDVSVDLESELQGASFHFRRLIKTTEGCGDTIFCNLPETYRSRLDGAIGYRWMQLEEGLLISEDVTRTTAPTGRFRVEDQFDTRTQFHGLDMGLYYQRQRGCWTMDLRGRFGLGSNRQTVAIDGSTIAGTAAAETGGLLAQESNIGIRKRDRISVLPELGANLGYQLTPRLRATVGYTFIYWSNVVRPGDQIDTDLNGTFLPDSTENPTGEARPRFAFDETDYWVHGISFGGSYCW